MLFDKELEETRLLVESGNHEAALESIESLRNKGCDDLILVLFEALAKYDAGDDLLCLELIERFLTQSNNHIKHDYALFLSAVCLMNIGLASEARQIFQNLPDDYPELEKELRASQIKESRQRQALSYFIRITNVDN